MITEERFNNDIAKFNNLERRGSFYRMAMNLLKHGFEMEAYFLILATWNFARFRYAVNEFEIEEFRKSMKLLNPNFEMMKDEEFRTIDFDSYQDSIKEIFKTLSSIKGIEFTGATKVMHLRNPSIFVMWDGYIKGDKPQKKYNQLKVVKEGILQIKKYYNTPESYFQFLKDMQKSFSHINFQSDEKTFAKAIDEFNYVNITLPIQGMNKK